MDIKDPTLAYLVDLHGEIAELEQGYWVKFHVRRISANEQRPYGIKYSLTLHNDKGERILGYDNAHAVKRARKTANFDHVHKGERIKSYPYENAAKLMEDFWQDVNDYLKNKG